MSNKVVVLGPNSGDLKSDKELKRIKDLKSVSKKFHNIELVFVDSSRSLGEVLNDCKNAVVILPTAILEELSIIAEKIPTLKLIQTFSAGTDWIDKIKLAELGVDVANNNGANAVSVAEHAICLMFAVYRKLDQQIESVKNGKWMNNVVGEISEFHTLVNKRVGIIGLGRIGSRVSKRLHGWECKLFYYDSEKFNKNYVRESGASYLGFNELIESCDIITLHVPLDRTTKQMISTLEFQRMKKTAILINTCRGQVVDESAMIKALNKKEIFGVGLDVTEVEPIQADNPLLNMTNVVLTPHLATRSIESQWNSFENSLKNASKVINGNIADSIVKPI